MLASGSVQPSARGLHEAFAMKPREATRMSVRNVSSNCRPLACSSGWPSLPLARSSSVDTVSLHSSPPVHPTSYTET